MDIPLNGFVITSAAPHDSYAKYRRGFEELASIAATMDEIEQRAARPPNRATTRLGSIVKLSFAAAAGDAEARRKLRQRADRE